MYLNIIYWQKNEYKLKDAYLNTVPECSDFNSHICDKKKHSTYSWYSHSSARQPYSGKIWTILRELGKSAIGS